MFSSKFDRISGICNIYTCAKTSFFYSRSTNTKRYRKGMFSSKFCNIYIFTNILFLKKKTRRKMWSENISSNHVSLVPMSLYNVFLIETQICFASIDIYDHCGLTTQMKPKKYSQLSKFHEYVKDGTQVISYVPKDFRDLKGEFRQKKN